MCNQYHNDKVVLKYQMTMGKKGLVNRQLIIVIAVIPIVSGCVAPFFGGYGANGQTLEEFSHYVEKVFRFQNRMTSEVMMLQDSDDIKKSEALLKAEQTMQRVCTPLNEYVSRDIDGLNIGLFLRQRVEKSAEDCEKSAQQLQSLLEHL